MAASNPLRKFVNRVNQYPQWLSSRLLTWMFRSKVKLAGTAKIDIIHTDGSSVTFRQRNIKKVQNHIGGVHAAGMVLLAESATGFICGINLPGDKLPLVKSIETRFVRRSVGDMHATASLTEAQIASMKSDEKGSTTVTVVVTDDSGQQPIECDIVWAWVPKKKKPVETAA